MTKVLKMLVVYCENGVAWWSNLW